MKNRHFVSSICLMVAVIFLMFVAIHPAMAAEAFNKELDCPTCSGETENLTLVPGPESVNVPKFWEFYWSQFHRFTEKDNGTSAEISPGRLFIIRLREDPTTGYSWNASVSDGLEILSTYYRVDEHPNGMIGVGGNRTWILSANNTRNQAFTAVLKQPWMPVTGNEPTYRLDFGILTFTNNDNGTTTEISPGTRFAVQLRVNPTTGDSWNASVSDGLEILSTYYRVDEHPEDMVGVGGNRTWILSAKGTGNQTFAAVNKPAWMPGTGNVYLLGIRILSPRTG